MAEVADGAALAPSMTRRAHRLARATFVIAAAALGGSHVERAAADPISLMTLPLAALGGANALAATHLVAGGALDLALTNGTTCRSCSATATAPFRRRSPTR